MTITGTIKTANAHLPAEEARQFEHVKIAVFAFTRDSEVPEAAPEWQPVLSGPGGTGEPVIRYTDNVGRFEFEDMIYPQDYDLEDGTRWYGCEPTPDAFMRSHACEDGDVVLRVYGQSEDGTVLVKNADGQPALIAEIPIGRFFERDNNYTADTAVGHAYRAANDVSRLTHGLGSGLELGPVVIEMVDDYTRYDPSSGTMYLLPEEAFEFIPEHELGHKYMHDLYGDDLPGVPESCFDHYFTDPEDESCSFLEGFASFIALASSNGINNFDNTLLYWPNGYTMDLEVCRGNGPCQDGPGVEGRVAGALWDLYDRSPMELKDGFWDRVNEPFSAIPRVLRDFKPATFNEFFARWTAGRMDTGQRRDDQEAMFGNTLLYSGLFDAEKANSEGVWSSVECGDDCVGGEYLFSMAGAGQAMTWQIGSALGYGGKYDVWVHVPDSETAPNWDTQARYSFQTLAGPTTVVIDQAANAGRWIPLNDAGYDLFNLSTFTLRRGSEAPDLAADGVLISPRQG
ncbi:hypothetical protein [Catellatospora sp. NPDC049609]|uniref:golvesin C-terminal-like domain-containing protein n=1 Tax=Catellatospora sp. NPDC049609 TaxID=3155505 RepID=UPI003422A20E